MSFRKFVIPFLALTLFAFATLPLMAQTTTTGEISGTVTDSSGAIVPKATVTLKSADTGTSQTTTASSSGAYRFSLLKPGTYTISSDASGMQAASRTAVVLIGQSTVVPLQMGVKGSQETVEVTAEAPLLQTENANIATSYTAKQMDLIPNPGSDITYVAQTSPGIQMNTSSGGGYGNFTAFGLPATANLFTVNGNDEMDPYLNLNNSGATNLLLGANELQEAVVVSNGYTGQYGRQAGAQVDYATKSGSNAFHGNMDYRWNGVSMNAADWYFNHGSCAPNDAACAAAGGVPKTPKGFANNNQWAASIGGPIIKDKTFFFVSTEGLRYILATSTQTFIPTPAYEAAVINSLNGSSGLPNSVPFYNTIFGLYNNAPGASRATSAAGTAANFGCGDVNTGNANFLIPELAAFGDPNNPNIAPGTGGLPCANQFRSNVGSESKEWLMSARVDHSFGQKDKAYIRFKTDHGIQPTYTDPLGPLFNANSVQPQYEGQITETHVFTPAAVNQVIVSGSWYSAFFVNPNAKKANAIMPYNILPLDAPFAYVGGIDFDFPQGRNVTQAQLTDDFSLTKGNHNFKMGVNYRRNDVTDGLFGVLTVPEQFVFSNTDFSAGIIDRTRQRFPKALEQPFALYSLGTYFQDEWRASSNLKFTMALRIDQNSNPVCQHNCISRFATDFTALGHDPNVPLNQAIIDGHHQTFPDVEKVVLQPRFGFTWSPLGHTSTVIRGGVGLFPDLFPATLVDRFARNAPESSQYTLTTFALPLSPAEPNNSQATTAGCNTAFLNAYRSGGTIANFASAAPAGCVPPDVNSVVNTLKNPKYLEYNLEVQQAIGSKMAVSLNYVGNHGYDIFNINPFLNTFCRARVGRTDTCSPPAGGVAGSFGGVPVGTVAPDQRVTNVSNLTNAGVSNYNGLTASFSRKFSYGFQGQLNYTWSHTLDDISNGGVDPYSLNDSTLVQLNPFNLNNNYGNADYDVRHNFTANYLWEMPYKSSNTIMNYLISGWSVSGTFFAHSGYPFSVTDTTLPTRLRNAGLSTILADFTGTNRNCTSGPAINNVKNANGCFGDPNALPFPTATQRDFGNLARNSFRGPHYFNTDLTVNKNFKITERVNFRVGANAYNVLNHPNFGNPNHNVASGITGQYFTTVEPPTSPYGAFTGSAVSGRVLQLTGRITF